MRKNNDQGYSKSLNYGIIIPSFQSVLFFHFTPPWKNKLTPAFSISDLMTLEVFLGNSGLFHDSL